ncbi:MAG: class I SAM-dependent methyltransferase [Clostridium sp.]|nr:class I SAM-dependent methyltransferase [Clostridium sp.]
MNNILKQNKTSWNAMADMAFGWTALPKYGLLCPTEDDLHLFPDLNGKTVLDIGCGSGHSLKWCAEHGADELYGLDISENQLKNAKRMLEEIGVMPRLFCSPMEQNPGIPPVYFDVVYSVYAIGWTIDLQTTFNLISSYLKPNGTFIFSWDHPFMHCIETASQMEQGIALRHGDHPEYHDTGDERLIFSGCYYEATADNFMKAGNPLTLKNRRLCDYINALANAGFVVERVVEEADKETLECECEFSSEFYSPYKAKHFPLSLIVKAMKL